jgi:MoxR-like ATPase
MERTPRQPLEDARDESLNFHEVAKQRKELRKAVQELSKPGEKAKGVVLDGVNHKIDTREAIDRLNAVDEQAKIFKVKEYGGIREAGKALRASETKGEKELLPVDLDSIYEQFPEYKEIEEDEQYLALLKEKRIKQIFSLGRAKTNGEKDSYEIHLKATRRMIANTEAELAQFPPLDLHAAGLVRYKQNLSESGHIAMVPSTEKNLEAIGDKMLSGKPVFLFGLTGTGKTTLAQYAAKHYTGKDAETVACSPQTKESNVYGHMGIVSEGGVPVTTFIYGPLANAMRNGTVVIFDEFTNLQDDQITFLKLSFAKHVGDTYSIPGNGEVPIAEGFQMIFTANLKSEKNPNKKALPAEMADEFTQNNLEIGYTPPEDAYDIMLARLLNRDGSLDMSDHDLITTLPNLCRAMADIQESYVRGTDKDFARQIGALESNGKAHSFEKFVTTQRSVEAIISLWEIEKQKGDRQVAFAEFLDERILTALNFKEFSEKDRTLAAKIFASRGFLSTVSPEELHIANAKDIFALNTVKARTSREIGKGKATFTQRGRKT